MSTKLDYQGFCREGEGLLEWGSGKTCYAPKYLEGCYIRDNQSKKNFDNIYARRNSHVKMDEAYPVVKWLKSGNEQCNSSKECGFYSCIRDGSDGGWYSFERREREEELKNRMSQYTNRKMVRDPTSPTGNAMVDEPWSAEELEAEAQRLKQNDIDIALYIGRSPTNYVFPDYY